MKINFLSQADKTYIDMNGFAPSLGLKRRLRATRKRASGPVFSGSEFPHRVSDPYSYNHTYNSTHRYTAQIWSKICRCT